MIFKVVIQQDEDGRYNAECPELPGCLSYGDTIEDAKRNIREAIELYLEEVSPDKLTSIRVKVEFAEISL
ncbi:MAG TPA: type II toxin-antitoxin system HicB family antitoxin [bacterium]|jgi:predicted RNase H-like HicB family nuclease